MDAHTLIERQVAALLCTVSGVAAIYGEADLPLADDWETPAYFVTVTGTENLEHLGSEGWGGDVLVEREAQLDVGCVADASKLTFLPLVRELRTQALAKLSNLEALGIPGLFELRAMAVQRTEYPSKKGTLGGLFIPHRVKFASRLSDFSTIAPAN
jgi:hypothetical protein